MKSTSYLILIISIFLFSFHSLLRAQEEFIGFQNEPIGFKANGFYIKKVIDHRSDKDSIGFVQKGLFKKKKITAKMKNGLESSISNFLAENFKQDIDGLPIVLRITKLHISETSKLPVTGKAEIKMEFYREKNGSIGKLYEGEAFVEKPAVDVTKTHEERIREVIATCIESFNDSDWKTIEPMYFKEEEKN